MNTFIRSSNYLVIGSLVFFALHSGVMAGDPRPVVRDNIDTLLKTKSCTGCDLAGANLNRLDLSGADLSGADLSKAKLYLTNLANADLREANLQNAALGGADLAGADLRGADLRGAKLSGAYLVGAIRGEEAKKEFQGEIKSDTEVGQKSIEKSEKQGVAISERRDYEEAPPVVKEKSEITESAEIVGKQTALQNEAEDDVTIQQPSVQPDSPTAKTIKPIEEAVIKKHALRSADVAADNTAGKVKKESNISDPDPIIEEYIARSEPVEKQLPPNMQPGNVDDTLAVDLYEPDEDLASSGTTQGVTDVSVEPIENLEEKNIKEGTVSDEIVTKGKEGREEIDSVTEKVKEDFTYKERAVERLLDTNKCYGCDLTGVDLSGKDLDEADLEAADLTGSNLENVDFQEANLKGAVLHNANLRNADLSGADLYKADLSGADLSGADLEEAKLDGAQITGAIGLQVNSVMGVE